MLPAFRSGHEQQVGVAGDLRFDALDPRRLGRDRVVEAERPLDDSARPIRRRAPSSTSACASSVAGIAGFTVSTAATMPTFGCGDAEPLQQADRVGEDVALGRQVRRDVDHAVGERDQLGVARQVEQEGVADPRRAAQAGALWTTADISSSVCSEPFISAPTLAVAREPAGARRGFGAARRRWSIDLEAPSVDARPRRRRRAIASRGPISTGRAMPASAIRAAASSASRVARDRRCRAPAAPNAAPLRAPASPARRAADADRLAQT